jgi:hypothetical protein
MTASPFVSPAFHPSMQTPIVRTCSLMYMKIINYHQISAFVSKQGLWSPFSQVSVPWMGIVGPPWTGLWHPVKGGLQPRFVSPDFSRAEAAAYPRSRSMCYSLPMRVDRATKEMRPNQLASGEHCVEQSASIIISYFL